MDRNTPDEATATIGISLETWNYTATGKSRTGKETSQSTTINKNATSASNALINNWETNWCFSYFTSNSRIPLSAYCVRTLIL